MRRWQDALRLTLAAAGLAVSIDSRRASVMAAALDAGALLVNDVSALSFDAESLGLIARRGVPVVLMHSRGDPQTMQDAPQYDCAPLDVFDDLEARIDACLAAGMARERIIVDPGIGFAKSPPGASTPGHNIEILQRLGLLHGLGCAAPPGRRGPGGRVLRPDCGRTLYPGRGGSVPGTGGGPDDRRHSYDFSHRRRKLCENVQMYF